MRSMKYWQTRIETKLWRGIYAVATDDPVSAFLRGVIAGALVPTLVALCLM